MRVEIEVAMDYQLSSPETVLLTLEAAPLDRQIIQQEQLDIRNATLQRMRSGTGQGQRVWACVPCDRLVLHYTARVELHRPETPLTSLRATPIQDLPPEILTYLRPSRFCPSDLFEPFAAKRFGQLEGGEKIAAIRDWVAAAITYMPGSSVATTCANDTFLSRQGVCRDFAHLVCTLARAAQIPARYTAGYSPNVTPPDFHAVAEVWLDGAWHVVDPTGMSSAANLVVIGSGRDACDMAFMETKGPAYPISHSVRVL